MTELKKDSSQQIKQQTRNKNVKSLSLLLIMLSVGLLSIAGTALAFYSATYPESEDFPQVADSSANAPELLGVNTNPGSEIPLDVTSLTLSNQRYVLIQSTENLELYDLDDLDQPILELPNNFLDQSVEASSGTNHKYKVTTENNLVTHTSKEIYVNDQRIWQMNPDHSIVDVLFTGNEGWLLYTDESKDTHLDLVKNWQQAIDIYEFSAIYQELELLHSPQPNIVQLADQINCYQLTVDSRQLDRVECADLPQAAIAELPDALARSIDTSTDGETVNNQIELPVTGDSANITSLGNYGFITNPVLTTSVFYNEVKSYEIEDFDAEELVIAEDKTFLMGYNSNQLQIQVYLLEPGQARQVPATQSISRYPAFSYVDDQLTLTTDSEIFELIQAPQSYPQDVLFILQGRQLPQCSTQACEVLIIN